VCFRVFSAILRLFPRHVINLAGYIMVSALSTDFREIVSNFRDIVPRVIKVNKVWSQIGPNDTPRICQRVAQDIILLLYLINRLLKGCFTADVSDIASASRQDTVLAQCGLDFSSSNEIFMRKDCLLRVSCVCCNNFCSVHVTCII
jgi:hypothetical protein